MSSLIHACSECGCVWASGDFADDPDEARTCPDCGAVEGSIMVLDEGLACASE